MADKSERRSITKNRKARFEYEITESLEAGLALHGSEVKSLRGGQGSLREAYVRIDDGEAWLIDAHIAPYKWANQNNHEPRRRRKLLLHRREIDRLQGKIREKGLTAIPLELYFLGSTIKCEVGLARGKKLHDKRATIKERDAKREIARALKHR